MSTENLIPIGMIKCPNQFSFLNARSFFNTLTLCLDNPRYIIADDITGAMGKKQRPRSEEQGFH